MQLNLHQLWIFMTVVERGGFSAAADKLYLSQSAVSQQVRRLEKNLRTVLIDRSGSRIRVTSEGEVLLDYTRRMFLLADEAVAAIQRVSGMGSGTLVIGGSSGVAAHLLPPVLASFRARYDGIEIGIVAGNADQIEKRLLDGDLGVALLGGPARAAQLVTATVAESRPVLIVPAGHPLAAGAEPVSERIAGERILLREPGSATRRQQEEVLARWGLADTVATSEIWGTETVKQAVAAGLGIAVLPDHSVAGEPGQRRFAVLPVAQGRPCPVVVAHRKDRLLTPAEQAFIDVLQAAHDGPPRLRAIS
ncbi:LysR family transcriptional regulator [Actinocorallia lasiicapitis]